MTNRLVWNFEFTSSSNFTLSNLAKEKEDELKWEARFFWSETEIISLNLLDKSLLELTHYQHKQKKDEYYLLKQNYNIKNRRNELIYKPLIKKGRYSLGFGQKLNLSDLNKPPHEEFKADIKNIMLESKQSKPISVKKESFSYKFSTQPNVKLELAKIEINSINYFTLCVEGRSRVLVESISTHLLGKKNTEDYVSFLKKFIQHYE